MGFIKKYAEKLGIRKSKSLQERYPQYLIGRGTYGTPQVNTWGEGTILTIGAFCSFAPGVQIFLGGEHRTDWVTTYPFNVLWKAGDGIKGHPKTKGDVKIGNDVWIGSEAIIMSGVIIGDGAVVGTRAVVVTDIPPYTIAVGNPARIIRKRFNEEIIKRLLEVAWWNWENSRIEKALPLLLSDEIESFLEAVEKDDI